MERYFYSVAVCVVSLVLYNKYRLYFYHSTLSIHLGSPTNAFSKINRFHIVPILKNSNLFKCLIELRYISLSQYWY